MYYIYIYCNSHPCINPTHIIHFKSRTSYIILSNFSCAYAKTVSKGIHEGILCLAIKTFTCKAFFTIFLWYKLYVATFNFSFCCTWIGCTDSLFGRRLCLCNKKPLKHFFLWFKLCVATFNFYNFLHKWDALKV